MFPGWWGSTTRKFYANHFTFWFNVLIQEQQRKWQTTQRQKQGQSFDWRTTRWAMSTFWFIYNVLIQCCESRTTTTMTNYTKTTTKKNRKKFWLKDNQMGNFSILFNYKFLIQCSDSGTKTTITMCWLKENEMDNVNIPIQIQFSRSISCL